MSTYRISDHPKFHRKLDPDDPNFERDQYLEILDDQREALANGSDPFLRDSSDDVDPESELLSISDEDLLEHLAGLNEHPPTVSEMIEEARSRREPEALPLSICQGCALKLDKRPRWRQFLWPMGAQSDDLLCTAFPRDSGIDPITGRPGYHLEGSSPTIVLPGGEAFTRCWLVNPVGKCQLFKPAFIDQRPKQV